MGRRATIALVVVACAAGPAWARGKKKVQIVSKPDGASVYLDSIENGELCQTPCSIEVGSNNSIIILDKKGYKPEYKKLTFGRRERAPYTRTYTLTESIGNLKISGPDGAVVFIDTKEKGKLPFDEDVPAGNHVVSVKNDGKEIYTTAVEVPEDEEIKVAVPAETADSDPIDEEPDPVDEPDPPKIVKKAPATPRAGSLFAMSAAFSVGFRDFQYRNVNPMTTRTDLGPETEGGQVLAGVVGEVWPGTLAGVRALRGLSVFVRAQLGVNSQTVIEDNNNSKLGARTFWRSFEASVHQRWRFGSVGVGVAAGYVRDQHQFEGDALDIAKVPDADYQSLKIGAMGSYKLGMLEPYLAAENRIVMDGGSLGGRFPDANASGLRGAAGVGLQFGHLGGTIEGSLTRYSWTFRPDTGVDTDGATDSIAQVSLSLGYAY